MNLITIVKPMLERAIICDHCLGRQFALLGTGLENSERGMYLRNACILDAHRVLKKSSGMENEKITMNQNLMKTQAITGSSIASRLLERLAIPMEGASKKPATPNAKGIIETVDCIICRGIFSSTVLLNLIDDAIDITNEMEFSTMLVGTRISPIFLEREEEFRVLHGLKWGESFKSHFNRFIGRKLTLRIGKEVDFSRPDLVFIFNISDKDSINISVQLNPYFIYGRYKKNIRGIPQTHWPHKACNGKGCEECDNTGKQYQESVEELIAKPVIEETRAGSIKFHGAGREDIDARMLGTGRPFVVEIIQGMKRDLDYKQLEQKINSVTGGKVTVHGLRESSKQEMQDLKQNSSRTRKKYRAVCMLERPLETESLENIKDILETTVIEQQTPKRVLHRRADKVRKKKVFEFSWEHPQSGNDKEIILEIEASGGTYIKELISSDDGRTVPSVSGLSGQKVVCKELDVIEIVHL